MRVSTFVFALLLLGCPRSRTPDDPSDAGEAMADARVGRRDVGVDAPLVYDAFVEPTCDGAVPIPDPALMQCDPYRTDGCEPGLGCYPYVIYSEDPCARTALGAECLAAGTGGQDEHCFDYRDCGPGLTCFVTGTGDRCLRLCDTGGGEPRCPRGRICGLTDLSGFGACF